MTRMKLGLIVNPIAGMGGRVGLKGTDGQAILDRARSLGGRPMSAERAARALAKLAPVADGIDIETCPGEMGARSLDASGLAGAVIGSIESGRTSAADSRRAARAMRESKVDLLVFAGGDGTARDLYDEVGDEVPMLGIPTGVKMHSAVFGTSPEGAGRLVAGYLTGERSSAELRDAEIMDIDENAMRQDRLSATLYGYAKSPYRRSLVQNAKAGAAFGDRAAVEALCADVASMMADDCLYIVGPGTTTHRILEKIGLAGTLLGVDAVRDGRLVGKDLSEADILGLLDSGPAKIIVSVVGGQGYVFGRGNQQISGAVIDRVGADNIVIAATMDKIVALNGGPLRVDTGDDTVDTRLSGFTRVHTGPGQSAMLRVER